ncbi:hypothetical protein HG535_0E02640 [Zygotorulaspora mrakii]|uniref:Ribonuclease P/MRP protein subunit POP5 n=1 Tax=Zygotorulaspora mrakii TaxID=42260 RepID=A0A7H9B3I9_ZYGMR|nr:uncharacterized protein HG535_0E02640 [Zygotorulaspora mrakii]QLG73180.1 hypothetical protein HG535_0E02640 [Zygotorulaspora mrakii]
MVRLKSRYILFEIVYPTGTDSITSSLETGKDIFLRHHQITPPDISSKTLLQEIRKSLQLNFGDYGLGKVSSLLQVKYFSNMTSTGILRCHREDCDLLVMALFLMKKISNTDRVIVNPIKVSGTIKKIEEYSCRRNQRLLSIIKQDYECRVDDFTCISEDEEQE